MASILARACLLPDGHRQLLTRNLIATFGDALGHQSALSAAEAVYRSNWAHGVTDKTDPQADFDISYTYWRELYDHYGQMRSVSDSSKKGVASRHPLPELPAQIPMDFAWW